MQYENLVSKMMTLNNLGRLYHWATDSAQHHVVFEKFLQENEQHTDSFVESILGNDIAFNIGKLSIISKDDEGYSLEKARQEISNYRSIVRKFQGELEKIEDGHSNELTSILDGVIELSSKTLYLLKLK